MKKNVFLLIMIMLILTGCFSNEQVVNQTNKKLYFSKRSSEQNLALIYEFEDGRKVLSEFSDIEYEDNEHKKISLSEALRLKYISLNEIINQTKHSGDFNDGGSKTYEYKVRKNKFANMDFTLAVCKNLNGNNNIVFGKDYDVIKWCN